VDQVQVYRQGPSSSRPALSDIYLRTDAPIWVPTEAINQRLGLSRTTLNRIRAEGQLVAGTHSVGSVASATERSAGTWQQKSNGNATAPLNSLAEWRQPNESRTHT